METVKEIGSRIKINDINWYIIEENEGIHLGKDDDNFVVGLCDTLEHKIYLYNKLEIEHKYKTLIHEMTHAYISSYGFKDIIFDEENICNFFEAYGKQIIDNTRTYIYQ